MRTRAGFTLIETLVAFVIAVLFIGTLLPLFADALRGVSSAEAHIRAVLWAESLIETLASDEALAEGRRDGTTADGFAWRAVVRRAAAPTRADAEGPRVEAFAISVAVDWDAFGRAQTVDLSTLRLLPVARAP